VEEAEARGALGTARPDPGSSTDAGSDVEPASSRSRDADTRHDIARPRLTDRLLCSPPVALVVLSAPAGYSKTTTLRSWAKADRRPFVWISCDRRHDDPAFLITSVAAAAGQLTPVDDDEVAAMAIEANWPEMALPRLAGLLQKIEVDFALVLDDAHLLQSDGSVELLQGLLEVLPEGAQLVIGSRGSPPVQLGRMRANRDLLELGIRDLAMTKREAQRLLRATGLDLEDHQPERPGRDGRGRQRFHRGRPRRGRVPARRIPLLERPGTAEVHGQDFAARNSEWTALRCRASEVRLGIGSE
jgi:LuxR family maltose regulon positive regulatory protein